MPPKKRRRENSIVRTEPDRRRATGAEDDDEIRTEAEDEDLWSRKYSTLGMTRYRREKAKRQKSTQYATFPFLKLPAEIRIIVYRCLVVSKAETPIDLTTNKSFVRGGIETAILTASRLVHDEAIKILYDENKCIAVCGRWQDGISLRRDDPKTKSTTSRTLRSGREVDMVKHHGLIYAASLHLIRNVEFRINIFDCKELTEHQSLWYAGSIVRTLGCVWALVTERCCEELGSKAHGRDWVVRINFAGQMPLNLLRVILLPILAPGMLCALDEGRFRLELQGPLQKGWREVFYRFLGVPGFGIDNVQEIDEKAPEVDDEEIEYLLGGIIQDWEEMEDSEDDWLAGYGPE